MSLDLVAVLGSVHGWWVYAVVAGCALLESAAFIGLVIPGETVMLLAGAVAALGGVDLLAVMAVGALGAVVGDQLGYLLGRVCGPGLRRGRILGWVGPARWARAEALVARRGGPAVFLARWVGVLRAVVPAVAGATGLPRARFTTWNAVGGIAWVVSVVGVGFLAGSSWATVAGWLGRAGVAGLAAAVIAGAAALGYRGRRRAVASGSSTPRSATAGRASLASTGRPEPGPHPENRCETGECP